MHLEQTKFGANICYEQTENKHFYLYRLLSADAHDLVLYCIKFTD